MTWIDWATVACVVYAALLSTLVAIRQQLRIRGEWERELLGYQQRIRANLDQIDLDWAKLGLAAPAADPVIKAGDPVCWDASGNPAPGRIFPGCVTKEPSDSNYAAARLDAAAFGVAVPDSQPVDPGVVK